MARLAGWVVLLASVHGRGGPVILGVIVAALAAERLRRHLLEQEGRVA